MLKVFEATKVLPIGVLPPDLQQPPLVADVEAMLEIAEPDHQSRRQRRSPGAPVEPSEGFLETRPVDQPAKVHEFVPRTDDVVELASEQVVGTGSGGAFWGIANLKVFRVSATSPAIYDI